MIYFWNCFFFPLEPLRYKIFFPRQGLSNFSPWRVPFNFFPWRVPLNFFSCFKGTPELCTWPILAYDPNILDLLSTPLMVLICWDVSSSTFGWEHIISCYYCLDSDTSLAVSGGHNWLLHMIRTSDVSNKKGLSHLIKIFAPRLSILLRFMILSLYASQTLTYCPKAWSTLLSH